MWFGILKSCGLKAEDDPLLCEGYDNSRSTTSRVIQESPGTSSLKIFKVRDLLDCRNKSIEEDFGQYSCTIFAFLVILILN